MRVRPTIHGKGAFACRADSSELQSCPRDGRSSPILDGDIGGFGVGSDITYNPIGTVGWDMTVFGNDATLHAGYRVLYQDYEDGSGADRFAYDVTTHGPMIGMNFQF